MAIAAMGGDEHELCDREGTTRGGYKRQLAVSSRCGYCETLYDTGWTNIAPPPGRLTLPES